MGIEIFFLIFFLGSSWAAYPAEEFLFDGFYAKEGSPGKYADVTGLKWKRVNKTAFQFSGSVTLLTDIDDTISAKVSLIGVDKGGDHYLFTREREKICTHIFEECKPCKSLMESTGFDPMPDKCPMKKGKYTIPVQEIARARANWPPFLKLIIPPLVPFENWKINMQFSRDGELLDEFIMAFRLINKFSAV